MSTNNSYLTNNFISRLQQKLSLKERLPEFSLATVKKEAAELHFAYIRELSLKNYLYSCKENHNPTKGPLTSSQLVPYEDLNSAQQQLWMAATQSACDYFASLNFPVVNEIQELIRLVAEAFCSWFDNMGTKEDHSSGYHLFPFATRRYNPYSEESVHYTTTPARELLCACVLHVQCDYSLTAEYEKQSQRKYGSTPDIHEVIENTLCKLLYQIAEKVHDQECRARLDDGWNYGPTSNPEAKLWPAFLPFGKCYHDSELNNEVLYAIGIARLILQNLIKSV